MQAEMIGSTKLTVLQFYFFKDFIYLFLERGEERERNMCGCLLRAPHWGPGPQPKHVP